HAHCCLCAGLDLARVLPAMLVPHTLLADPGGQVERAGIDLTLLGAILVVMVLVHAAMRHMHRHEGRKANKSNRVHLDLERFPELVDACFGGITEADEPNHEHGWVAMAANKQGRRAINAVYSPTSTLNGGFIRIAGAWAGASLVSMWLILHTRCAIIACRSKL